MDHHEPDLQNQLENLQKGRIVVGVVAILELAFFILLMVTRFVPSFKPCK